VSVLEEEEGLALAEFGSLFLLSQASEEAQSWAPVVEKAAWVQE